jgi:hypothetical protein
VAIAHKILRIAFAILKKKEPYKDSTVDYEALMVKRNAARWIQALKKFHRVPVYGPDGTIVRFVKTESGQTDSVLICPETSQPAEGLTKPKRERPSKALGDPKAPRPDRGSVKPESGQPDNGQVKRKRGRPKKESPRPEIGVA